LCGPATDEEQSEERVLVEVHLGDREMDRRRPRGAEGGEKDEQVVRTGLRQQPRKAIGQRDPSERGDGRDARSDRRGYRRGR
jgi:hypothetical protein